MSNENYRCELENCSCEERADAISDRQRKELVGKLLNLFQSTCLEKLSVMSTIGFEDYPEFHQEMKEFFDNCFQEAVLKYFG